MEAKKYIAKTREYLDYLERHIQNVEKAWEHIRIACAPILGPALSNQIDEAVRNHDLSKLSAEEFVQYRKKFYPVDDQDKAKSGFAAAWSHHKRCNSHHIQNWAIQDFNDPEWKINCVHMIVDWEAMGYEFGDNAETFYRKKRIKVPSYAVEFVEQIFSCLDESPF